MARKRGIFPTRVQFQPFLTMTKAYRRLLVLILGALLGLLSALSLPAWSNIDRQSSVPPPQASALELAQSGQQRYQAGQFNEAVQLWQQAAQVYERAGDREGMNKSLINKSQALQELGLYDKSCDTLLQVFAVDTLNCNSDQVNRLLTTLPDSEFSLTEAIGLRSLGNVLRRQGFLQPSQAVLQLSLATVAETPEQSATLLSLANTERALGNQSRNRWDYEEITEIIDSQSFPAALAPYQQALDSLSTGGNGIANGDRPGSGAAESVEPFTRDQSMVG